jgi:GLPGLI family protein
MKKIILSFFVFAASFLAHAQTGTTKIVGKIYYTTIHVRDTLSGDTFTETSVLFFGNGESLFRSYDFLQALNNTKKMEASGKTTFGNVMGRGTSYRYYVIPSKNEVWRVHAYGASSSVTTKPNYVMPELIEKINWKIERETKKIDKYICQKATGYCRGRTYSVWFCADIPYSFGPWKLTGLPGLIFEAEDERHQIVFRFNRIEFLNGSDEYIEAITNSTVTTEKEFERMREASVNIISPPGMTIVSSLVDAQGKPVSSPSFDKRLIHNPIDLVTKLPRLDMQ